MFAGNHNAFIVFIGYRYILQY